MTSADWLAAKQQCPVGARIRGTVERVEPFGVFVRLQAGGSALLLLTHFEDGEHSFDQGEYPQVGHEIDAIVVHHAEHNRQIRISTRDSDMARC